jgi:hypothetical protein
VPLRMERDGLVVPMVPGHGGDVDLGALSAFTTRQADIAFRKA